jgi:hypothetical protein
VFLFVGNFMTHSITVTMCFQNMSRQGIMNWKECRKKRSCFNLRCLSGICSEVLRITLKLNYDIYGGREGGGFEMGISRLEGVSNTTCLCLLRTLR